MGELHGVDLQKNRLILWVNSHARLDTCLLLGERYRRPPSILNVVDFTDLLI